MLYYTNAGTGYGRDQRRTQGGGLPWGLTPPLPPHKKEENLRPLYKFLCTPLEEMKWIEGQRLSF